jgi:hypothetical protein
MSATREPAPTYTFGRRDRGGLLLGLRLNQLLTLAAGLGVLLVGLVTDGRPGGVLGLVVLVAAATMALCPVQGRALVDWVRPLSNHWYGRLTGTARYLGGPNALHRCGDVARLDLPGLGQHLRLYEALTVEGPIAAVRMGSRWTMALQVRGRNYVLADRATQERRIAAWGALLSMAGQEGSRVAALQWLERTVPDNGHDLKNWWAERGDQNATYATFYEKLIERAGPTATRHETYLAVSIDHHRLRRAIRQAGGGPEGTTRVLLGELAWVWESLARAEIEVVSTVGAGDLARLIRTQYDPRATAWPTPKHASEGAPVPATSPVTPAPLTAPIAAGPVAAESHWDHYRSDSGFHAVFWIAEWPSVPVEAAWFYPLIALGGVRRTVSVTAEPIAPSRSMRELRGQRVAKRADDAQRRRLGQVETAQDDEESAALDRRERELVRGHTEYRFTGWITVTAAERDRLEEACAKVEQAAVRSALEVRRIYGEVDQAFLRAALPLNVGVHR